MVSGSATARRAIVSSTRRIGISVSNQCRSRQRHLNRRMHSSLVASKKSGIPNSSASRQFLRRPNNDGIKNRSLSSSAPPSSKPPTSASSSGGGSKKKTASTEMVPNIALASVLGGFVTFVFLYSMNAVGRGDGDASEGNDPLAQLKAEAQEAREHRDRVEGGGRMTEDEIRALESGIIRDDGEIDGDRIITEVAVAAPADIAALEEEANMKIFRKHQEDKEPPKKKKPWYRFGF